MATSGLRMALGQSAFFHSSWGTRLASGPYRSSGTNRRFLDHCNNWVDLTLFYIIHGEGWVRVYLEIIKVLFRYWQIPPLKQCSHLQGMRKKSNCRSLTMADFNFFVVIFACNGFSLLFYTNQLIVLRQMKKRRKKLVVVQTLDANFSSFKIRRMRISIDL